MDPDAITRSLTTSSSPHDSNVHVSGPGAVFASNESGSEISVETFFLDDDVSSTKMHPSEDKRVYMEARSRKQDFDFDVIFVHSLGVDRYDSWRCGHAFWPDYVLDDLPGARVLLFNYDTHMWTKFSLETIHKTVNDLLRVLRKARGGAHSGKPMKFITHSLAGLLVKEVCCRLSPSPHLGPEDVPDQSILYSTIDAIFIGTPHRALSVNGWQPILYRIYDVAGKSTHNSHVPAINAVEDVSSKFDSVFEATDMRIFSFFEQHEAPKCSFPNLVTSFQNGLYHPRETQETLPGNHLTMCQFQSPLDPGYRILSNALQAIRSVPRNLDISTPNTPAVPPMSMLELSTVFAVQDMLSRKSPDNPSSRDEKATLVPPSVMSQFAPALKLRRLKRLLSLPQSYDTNYFSTHNRKTLSNVKSIVKSDRFRDWLDSDSLLIIRGLSGSDKSTLAYQIFHFLLVEQLQSLDYFPHRCVLSYFFTNSLDSGCVLTQMLNQILLQFLEIIPALVRHFPTSRVFGHTRSNWPEWDAEIWTENEEHSKRTRPDLDPVSQESEPISGPNHKNLLTSPLTLRELVEILLSILHDDQVGEVILVIDGLDYLSESVQSQFQYFLEMLESLRSKQVKVYLSCHTTEIRSLKRIVMLDPLSSSEPIFQPDEDVSLVFRAMDESYKVSPSGILELKTLAEKISSIHVWSHLTVALVRQILGGLSSLDDIKAFTAHLQQWRLGPAQLGIEEIHGLYQWAFDHLMKLGRWRQISLLFTVAVAARPLTAAEANDLVPSPVHFASWYEDDDIDTTREERNTSKLVLESSTIQEIHTLFFGLVRLSHGTLTTFHPSFKAFLLEKLSQTHVGFRLHHHIGITCLRLLQDLDKTGNRTTYDWKGRRITMPIENFSYPLRYWSTHITAAHSFNQWSDSHSLQVLSLLSYLWDKAKIRALIQESSTARLPPVSDLSLSCLLAGHDLSRVLETMYLKETEQLPLTDEYLSLEQRCAAVNLAYNAQEVMRKYTKGVLSNDGNGRVVEDYETWARSRYSVDDFFLPDWIPKMMGKDKSDECDWETVRCNTQNASVLCQLQSKRHLEPLLALAVRRSDLEVVTNLLNYGADYKKCIDHGDTRRPSIVHLAAATGNADLVTELVNQGSPAFMADAFGMRPIHWAAERGHHKIVEFLFSSSSERDEGGQSPLLTACESLEPLTISGLVDSGLDVNFSDSRKLTPIHVAAAAGAEYVVCFLYCRGANPEAQDENGITPLHVAAFGGWTSVVDELLAKRVLVDARTNALQTPLHFACESPNPSLAVVLTLLRGRCNPRAMDSKGMTPLHIAVRKGSVAMVQLLLLRLIPLVEEVEELLELAKENEEMTRIIQQHRRLAQVGSLITSPIIDQGQLFSQQQSKVNIVFVHGYYDSPTSTWCDGSASWLWPAKYLPASDLHARVFFWDRQIEPTDFLSVASARDLGVRLLNFVRSTVYAPDMTSEAGKATPLVFVSHSLGGLAVKAAISAAVETHDSLLGDTKGLVFLGTPHKGPDQDDLIHAVDRLVQGAIDNRLQPWQQALFCRRSIRHRARPKEAEEYNLLDLEFTETCQHLRIKVLSVTEKIEQSMPAGNVVHSPSFAQAVSVDKDHGSLPRLSYTGDVVFEEIVKFTREVLTQETDFAVDLPDQQDDDHYVAEEMSSPGPSFSPKLRQPADIEDDITSALQRYAGSYIPDISNTVTSSLLEPLSGTSNELVESRISSWLKYTNWSDIWIQGEVGSGKTIFMAQLYHHLIQAAGAQRNWDTRASQRLVAAFFFNTRLQGHQTANDMLRSVLCQIFVKRGDLMNLVFQDGDTDSAALFESPSSWETLKSIFTKTLKVASDTKFFLLLDALNECEHDRDSRSRVYRFINDVRLHPNLKICFSSRPWNEFLAEFSKVPQLLMEKFNSSDIAKYVWRRLAKASDLHAGISHEIASRIISLSCGSMLWAVLTVDAVAPRVENGDSDAELYCQIDRNPEALQTLYKRMLDDIPSQYKRDAARIFGIIAIVSDPLDIDLLALAIEDYHIKAEPGSLIQELQSDLQAINAKLGSGCTKTKESAREERHRAIMRVNSRCGGLLCVEGSHGIRFIHNSVKRFLSESRDFQQLVQESTDTSFHPPLNLLSACIIRLKQSDIDGWQSGLSTAENERLITFRVSRALAAAALADIEPGPSRHYARLFDELCAVCFHIQHLAPLPAGSSHNLAGPGSFTNISYEHYRVLMAIKAQLWGYLRVTIDEDVINLQDGSNVSLLTHLINAKDLAALPWATATWDSHDLPPPDIVESFFFFHADPNAATATRNVWREVLEAGYHVLDADTVPSDRGPAQTCQNADRWVKIMGLFLDHGANTRASFPNVSFQSRHLGAPSAEITSPWFKTLEPKQTLRDVLRLNRDYHDEFQQYVQAIGGVGRVYERGPVSPAAEAPLLT